MSDFKIGEQVSLIGDSQIMVVEAISSDKIVCIWRDKEEFKTRAFVKETLEKYIPFKETNNNYQPNVGYFS